MLRVATSFLRVFWNALYKFFGDGCPGTAAALSFYTFFSLPALLALLLSLVGLIWDPAAIQGAITTQVSRLIGPAGADQVATVIRHARGSSRGFSIGTVLSLAAVAFGATTAFAQLQSALNNAWAVKPDPQRNQLKVFLVKRIFSFGVVLAVAFLLLVSLVLSTAFTAFGGVLSAHLPATFSTTALEIANAVLSFAVVTALFAVMFEYLPDAKVAWRDVWAGAVATALLFVGGKTVIGLYLGSTDPGTAYGAAGSLAIVLIWVYYSSMIVLYGAELTRAWSDRFGSGVRPEEGAVEVEHEERTVRRGTPDSAAANTSAAAAERSHG